MSVQIGKNTMNEIEKFMLNDEDIDLFQKEMLETMQKLYEKNNNSDEFFEITYDYRVESEASAVSVSETIRKDAK